MKNVELLCDVGDSIGYIRKSYNDQDVQRYELRESTVIKVSHGKTGWRVYTKHFRPFDMDEIRLNTKIMNGDNIVVVDELFVLDEKTRQKAECWIDGVNNHPEMDVGLLDNW